MANSTRREFLERILKTSAAGAAIGFQGTSILTTLLSCSGQSESEPLKGGNFVRTVAFVGESNLPANKMFFQGLNGRKFFDLATVKENGQITPTEQFFIRTGPPQLPELLVSWSVQVKPELGRGKAVPIGQLIPAVAPMGAHLIECAGNDRPAHFGLMSVANWGGIPLVEVLKKWNFSKNRLIKVAGFDKHTGTPHGSVEGASWVFTYEQLEQTGAFLATQMNGADLPVEHGAPARLIVPGWYACTHFKWLSEISGVPDNEPPTSQMMEFASRTNQNGEPKLAKDFSPANVDFVAMPVRVEQWQVGTKTKYLVAGISWGGTKSPEALMIRFNNKSEYVPVKAFQHSALATWSVWSHVWTPKAPGRYRIQLRVNDRTVPTRKMGVGYYARKVDIPSV